MISSNSQVNPKYIYVNLVFHCCIVTVDRKRVLGLGQGLSINLRTYLIVKASSCASVGFAINSYWSLGPRRGLMHPRGRTVKRSCKLIKIQDTHI